MWENLFMRAREYLDRQSQTFFLSLGFVIVLLVGLADHASGKELNFAIFYLLPISFVTWFASRNSGVLIAFVSAFTEFVANYFAGRTYSYHLITFWNSAVLFGFFALYALILSKLKTEYKRGLKLVSKLQNLVSELKRTKDELEQKSQDLARSNVELEQFASAVSHDLKEPLLAITINLTLLNKRYTGKLGSDADTFIAEIIDEAKQMQTLISDMLSYSRVGISDKPFVLTDFTDILNRLLANLRIPLEQSSAVVTHDSLPEVMADPIQLFQLLQNLIGNAIKFRDKNKPLIHISAKRKEQEWVFSVSDNGIGIPEEYTEKIFEMFKRLHNKKEYPGTGIGLATCKKIVERHGGHIWVESNPDRGSTFYFTIPDRSISD
jgi:signal transduction histidine kinase